MVRCYCGSEMKRRLSPRYGRFWGCRRFPDCDGIIGCHPDGRPLGTPANKETRRMRQLAHDAFDNWWPAARMTRGEAYEWLEENGPKGHIADMTLEDCAALIEKLENHWHVVREVAIPQIPMVHDRLWIYRRRAAWAGNYSGDGV